MGGLGSFSRLVDVWVILLRLCCDLMSLRLLKVE